jgi:hypothetical protein
MQRIDGSGDGGGNGGGAGHEYSKQKGKQVGKMPYLPLQRKRRSDGYLPRNKLFLGI